MSAIDGGAEDSKRNGRVVTSLCNAGDPGRAAIASFGSIETTRPWVNCRRRDRPYFDAGTGTETGAPEGLIMKTRNFVRAVLLGLRDTV